MPKPGNGFLAVLMTHLRRDPRQRGNSNVWPFFFFVLNSLCLYMSLSMQRSLNAY